MEQEGADLERIDSIASQSSQASAAADYEIEDDFMFGSDEEDEWAGAQRSVYESKGWVSMGGEAALLRDLLGLERRGYRSLWRRGDGEVVVCIELPYVRFGLSLESAHSMRLEPGCTVVVKAFIPDTADNATSALRTTTVTGPGRTRVIPPKAEFFVYKALPETLPDILAGQAPRPNDIEIGLEGNFGFKWSLEHMLNQLFPKVLAVESPAHLPLPVSQGSSMAYVRELLLMGAPEIDSEQYAQEEHGAMVRKALATATAEAVSGPQLPVDGFANGNEADLDGSVAAAVARESRTNHFLRLAEFLRTQLTLCSRFCMVCHAPMGVAGLKPFVCDSQLCVHQYTALSLGANADLEVENNPDVVDLLLSLCYVYVTTTPTLDPVMMPGAIVQRVYRYSLNRR